MRPLLSQFWQPANTDSNLAIQTLLLLRLLVLTLATVALIMWNLFYEPYQYWALTIGVFSATALWSLLALQLDSLKVSRFAEIRELLIDVGWVLAIVFVAGRTTNPFIYYYLVITAIGATLLSSRSAWSLCGLCVALYTAMLVMDVKDHFTHFSNDYKIHLIGMWINYVGSSATICFFVSRLIKALRRQQLQMADIRENNLRNEQLIALATVSASTVHNLATPLSTLTLLVDEVAGSKELDEQAGQDLEVMREQISRCQSEMQKLSALAARSDEKTSTKVAQLVNELTDHYALHFPDNTPIFTASIEQHHRVACSPLFAYALINLINNAMESTDGTVYVDFTTTRSELCITIKNAYDRPDKANLADWGGLTISAKETGLGIGSLLANSTIEQQGGEVKLDTLPNGDSEDLVVVTVKLLLCESRTGTQPS